jgi:hypothetical protein
MRVLAEPEEPFVVIGGEGLFELLVPGATISPKEPDLARRTDRGGYGPDAYRRCATLLV